MRKTFRIYLNLYRNKNEIFVLKGFWLSLTLLSLVFHVIKYFLSDNTCQFLNIFVWIQINSLNVKIFLKTRYEFLPFKNLLIFRVFSTVLPPCLHIYLNRISRSEQNRQKKKLLNKYINSAIDIVCYLGLMKNKSNREEKKNKNKKKKIEKARKETDLLNARCYTPRVFYGPTKQFCLI